jgi:vitamin K-dependent gamma-carboxylase
MPPSPRFHACGRVAAAALRPVDGAGLALARASFGAIVVWEVLRYVERGWIERYYVDAPLQFTYLFAPWLRPLPAEGMHAAFALLGVAGGLLALGLWTRAAAAATALLLGYVFLLEQARYLNHAYLMCLLALLFVLVPAGRSWSVDAWRRGRHRPVPAWAYLAVRL